MLGPLFPARGLIKLREHRMAVLGLTEQGYLAPLTGRKPSAVTINTDGLRIERGDYRESGLAELVDSAVQFRRRVHEKATSAPQPR